MLNQQLIDQFIAVSYLYLLVTDKSATDFSEREIQELIVAINGSNDQMADLESYLV